MEEEKYYAHKQAQALNMGIGLLGGQPYIKTLTIRKIRNGFLVKDFEGFEYCYVTVESLNQFICDYLKNNNI